MARENFFFFFLPLTPKWLPTPAGIDSSGRDTTKCIIQPAVGHNVLQCTFIYGYKYIVQSCDDDDEIKKNNLDPKFFVCCADGMEFEIGKRCTCDINNIYIYYNDKYRISVHTPAIIQVHSCVMGTTILAMLRLKRYVTTNDTYYYYNGYTDQSHIIYRYDSSVYRI